MKNFLIVTFLFLLLISCEKVMEKLTPDPLSITTIWSIPVEKALLTDAGAIYKDEYLVYTQSCSNAESCERPDYFIESYNLNTLNEKWNYKFPDFNGIGSAKERLFWGKRMQVVDDILYMERRLNSGILIFNLPRKETVATYLGDDIPDFPNVLFEEFSKATYQDHKIYFSARTDDLSPSSDWRSIIFVINTETGKIEEFYSSDLYKNGHIRFDAPLPLNGEEVFCHINENKNDVLAKINKTGNIIWSDTLSQSYTTFFHHTPALLEDQIIFGIVGTLVAYDKNSGIQNWEKVIPIKQNIDNAFEGIIARNEELFINQQDFHGFTKIDHNTGAMFWKQAEQNCQGIKPVDIQIVDDVIVFSGSNNFNSREYGKLILIDNNTGKCLDYESDLPTRIANPKYHESSNTFITHTENEIIGFRIER